MVSRLLANCLPTLANCLPVFTTAQQLLSHRSADFNDCLPIACQSLQLFHHCFTIVSRRMIPRQLHVALYMPQIFRKTTGGL
jgi:hypothetical protein